MQMLREIMLSFRLIFGQDSGSWKAFKKDFAKDDLVTDPLLPIICGQRWNKPSPLEIYTAVDPTAKRDVDMLSNYYCPDTQFPFFGKRLCELQNYSKRQIPHNWKLLWLDSRNKSNW